MKSIRTILLVFALAFFSPVFAQSSNDGGSSHGGMSPTIEVELEPVEVKLESLAPALSNNDLSGSDVMLLHFWTVRLLLAEIGIVL